MATHSGAEPQVVYVTAGNGMAVAALVLGIVGAVFGLVPTLAVPALICGILARIFGIVGRRKAVREPVLGRKKMATAGAILGAVAIGQRARVAGAPATASNEERLQAWLDQPAAA